MLKQKTFLFSFFFIFLISSSLVSAHYWDFVTIGQGDRRWCKLLGTCEITNLIVKNLTIDNGTVNFINKTVININVTGEMIIDGSLKVDNITVNDIFALIDEINMRNNVNYNEHNLNNASNVTLGKNQRNPVAGYYAVTVKLVKAKCFSNAGSSPNSSAILQYSDTSGTNSALNPFISGRWNAP